MKFIYRSALLALVFSSFAGVSVYAEEITNTTTQAVIQQSNASSKATDAPNPKPSSKLDMKAAVPQNFDKIVLISLVTADQKNVMGRLEKMNQYVFSQEIDPGTYKVSFINIVGENASSYEIKRPDEIVVQEGKSTVFEIQISTKPSNEEKTEALSDADEQKMVEGLMKADSEPNIPSLPKEPAPESHIVQDNTNVAPVQTAATTHSKKLDESAVNKIIGASALLVLGLLFFLYKQLVYKHEYYDC